MIYKEFVEKHLICHKCNAPMDFKEEPYVKENIARVCIRCFACRYYYIIHTDIPTGNLLPNLIVVQTAGPTFFMSYIDGHISFAVGKNYKIDFESLFGNNYLIDRVNTLLVLL